MAHVMNGMRKGNGRGKICGNDMGQNQRNKIMSKKYKKIIKSLMCMQCNIETEHIEIPRTEYYNYRFVCGNGVIGDNLVLMDLVMFRYYKCAKCGSSQKRNTMGELIEWKANG